MPGGGVLTLRSCCTQDGLVEIDIADQGVGIAQQDLEHIFDFNFTTRSNGSGLGLPLALRAIDLHQGSIDVQSREGGGTTFRIRLPAGGKPKGMVAGAATN